MQQELPQINQGGKGNYWILFGTLVVALVAGVLYHQFNTSETKTNSSTVPTSVSKDTIVSKNKIINESGSNVSYTNESKGTYKTKIDSTIVRPKDTVSSMKPQNPMTPGPTTTTVFEMEEKKTDPAPVAKENNCEGLQIETNTETEKTCEGKNTGSVTISVLKGGKSPYQFKLSGKNNFTNSNRFDRLAEGDYTVFIKESSGCIYELKQPIHIDTKVCKEPFSATFTPSQEPAWKLPIEGDQSGKMKFQDKAGRLVHEIHIQNGVPYEWDGSGNRGEEIPGGYYYVTIEFSDGSFTYGYLTINR
jgi:flagellar hook assembly protein FlgD